MILKILIMLNIIYTSESNILTTCVQTMKVTEVVSNVSQSDMRTVDFEAGL